MTDDSDWPSGYDGHWRDQMRRIARESTPTQRFHWLVETIEILGRNGLLRNKLTEKDPRSYGTLPWPGDDQPPPDSSQ